MRHSPNQWKACTGLSVSGLISVRKFSLRGHAECTQGTLDRVYNLQDIGFGEVGPHGQSQHSFGGALGDWKVRRGSRCQGWLTMTRDGVVDGSSNTFSLKPLANIVSLRNLDDFEVTIAASARGCAHWLNL
jgi:hypothetical protein